MAAPFSRLQLAAALIEYDNDDEDPSKPRRSAQDSAIFAPMRRSAKLRRDTASRQSTDYLGVALPSEAGSVRGPDSVYGGRDSVMSGRRSRASIDALRNPFGRDSTYEGALDEEEEEEGGEMEVDLASWGLDGYIPEDKGKGKQKAKRESLPNPYDSPARRPAGLRSEPGRLGIPASRSMSMGNFDDFGEGGAFLDEKSTLGLSARRHSFGTPLDIPADTQPLERPLLRGRRASTHALIDSLPITPPLHSIPFPSSETARSASPASADALNLVRSQSRGSESVLNRGRALSSASFGSQPMLNDEKPNPFAVRPPSPDRASRFDPKARGRTTSYGSLGTMLSPGPQEEESNPFAVRPPSPGRSSRFDPKARARTVSMASFGTQAMLDDGHSSDDNRSHAGGRSRPYSRLELMRPKVLIMPSPLQSSMAPTQTNGAMLPRAIEGAELHATDAAPLPPGARSVRRVSTTLSVLDPNPGLVASNSFTPNPRATLSLSQLTFRNNLVVDGQRDPAYADIEGHLRRATEEGEQVEEEPEPEPAPPTPAPEIVIDPADRSKRPAGKLFGRSLIDDIEARKAEMRSKQRVFRGDERPSMMARPQVQRSSTLIDPNSLNAHRPQTQYMDGTRSQPSMSRRNTLVQLDDAQLRGPRRTVSGNGPDASKKSVFGVDTLWERELAKLREIEEQERIEAEEEAKRQAEEDAKRAVKNRKKRKGKMTADERQQEVSSFLAGSTPVPGAARSPQPETLSSEEPTTAPSTPYVLPEIARATGRRRRPPPPPNDDSEESDDDDDDVPTAHKRSMSKDVAADEWIAGSSDEEEGARQRPRASSGAGLMGQPTVSMVAPRLPDGDDESSEEDVPLVATIGRAVQRATTRASVADDSSDEELPLSTLLDKAKVGSGSATGTGMSTLKLPDVGTSGGKLFPEADTGSDKKDDEDEDDKPLGLRVSRVINPSSAEADPDDDRPLAFHPEQVRKSQFMMMAQQQQQLQQQQMMMQAQAAQLHQSMIFSAPSMMASGFFGPPMAPPMVMPPPIATTPPPVHDAAKFGLVDKWRRDVAVEGEGQ